MVRDVLLVQKRELEDRLREGYVERAAKAGAFKSPLIHVVLGPRRAGKSFFAMHGLKKMGGFGYVNFDDERLAEIRDYDEVVAAVDALYGKPKRLLLDEIQNLPKWELFVNRLQRQGYRLVVTGSNAHLLSSELATHLTGRHMPVVLFPFSFSEYLRTIPGEMTGREKAEAFRLYAEEGGYPEPIIKKVDRREYLSTLLNAILYKDIVKRFQVRAVQGLENLVTYLMSNVANEYSLNSLANVTRCRSPHTVEKYLRYLEQAFLFFSLKRFSFKVKEQIRANRKIYCMDNGWITSTAFRFSPDRGRLYENLVAIALRRRELAGECGVFYWKNPEHEEVDFVVKEGLKVTRLIQVCARADDPKVLDRETRALLKAGKELKCGGLYVLTEGMEKEKEMKWFGLRGKIRFLPMWKWLMDCG